MLNVLTPKRVIMTLLFIGMAAVLYFYLPVFMPLLLAFFTALLLEPLVQLCQKKINSKHRLPSVIIVFCLFLAMVSSLVYLTITKIINEAIKFTDRLPYYIYETNYYIGVWLSKLEMAVADLPDPIIESVNAQLSDVSSRGSEFASNTIDTLTDWAQGIPNLIVVTLVYLITLFLISMDLPDLKERFYKRFSKENEEKVRFMSARLGHVFVGFFKAQFLVSIVILIVSYIGLLMIEPDSALVMATIIWLIDFIPIIGSIVVLAPWALFHFITDDPTMGVKLLVLAGVLLTLRRTLEPMIMGEQIGLSALSTLIAIYLGLYFFGILGLIIGPLFIIAFKSAMEAGIIKSDFKI
ncbi:sporulation integral membrane protein YtvI [Caldalkalibacillus salinus]|uniref:sporulation integral membrane protein YtvI n=1 Tax=Caldalkalibacillus salinus TaxID=2803787 RepID=UPI001F00A8FC|nr:sporulation integral membrane protein YtvI [Caldalkalibacillus salinus]